MQKNRKSSPHTIAHEEDSGLDIYGQKRFQICREHFAPAL